MAEVKAKNPGRVEWGKKLARMSKELKEKKKAQLSDVRSSEDQIEELIQKDIKIDTETKSELDLHRVEVGIAFAGLVIAGAALYFTWKSKLEPGRPEPGRPEQSKTVVQRLSINQSLSLEGPSPRGPSNTTLAISKKYFLII
jgi:L-lactate utilization protein LutC